MSRIEPFFLVALLVSGTLLACCLTASGCAREPLTKEYPAVGTWTEGMKPTDEQVQIARDMDCSEEEIARMQERGMSEREFTTIAYAQYGLDHLTRKYGGQAFRPLWIAKPSWFGRDSYTLAVTVEGGPLDGEKVELSFDRNGRSMDDKYWVMLHEADWEAYVEGVLMPAASGLPEGSCVISANALGSFKALDYGHLGASDAFEDHRGAIRGIACVYVLPSAAMPDADYDAFVDALVDALVGAGTSVDLEAARLASVPEGADLLSEEHPWTSVDEGTRERLVEVSVSHKGKVTYRTDERWTATS